MSILGKLIYSLYYKPKGKKAIIQKFGGKESYMAMLAAEREMRSYALNDLMIPGNFNDSGSFKINFLTGDQFIHQTLFCTYSFFRFLDQDEIANFSVNYYSDGTLSPELVSILRKRFPTIRIINSDETDKTLTDHLPQSKFPYLNKNVRRFPLFKKLIYPNLNNEGLLVFFDSDMLFLRRPSELLNWIYQAERNTDRAFCIQDVQRSYGYSDEEIAHVWPKAIEHDINSGLYALHSKNLDWSFFETLLQKFEVSYGSHYYMEQLMTAIMLERSPDLFVAPKSDYIVFPLKEQVDNQVGTLHHYVNESKEYYFKEGWRRQIR